eukprot:gene15659-biopygen1588
MRVCNHQLRCGEYLIVQCPWQWPDSSKASPTHSTRFTIPVALCAPDSLADPFLVDLNCQKAQGSHSAPNPQMHLWSPRRMWGPMLRRPPDALAARLAALAAPGGPGGPLGGPGGPGGPLGSFWRPT